MLLRTMHITGLLCAAALAGCTDDASSVGPRAPDPTTRGPSFTPGAGSISTLLGRATFSDPHAHAFSVERTTGDWHFEATGTPTFDIAVQTIDFQPGSYSGWHRHPGPVFIQVVSGTMTFYESDDPTCTPVIRTAGQGFLDVGDHAHMARNETHHPAQNVVTYFAPPGAALRIDQPDPGNCPF